MVPRHLREPIVAERISWVADKITFPLKNEYERVNITLEGKKDIASSREGPESLEMVDVAIPRPKLRYISEGGVHYSEGVAGDGNIYVDDDGYTVKLKLGRRYRVRSNGVKELPTSRPLGTPSEAWSRMIKRERRRKPYDLRMPLKEEQQEPVLVDDADDERDPLDDLAGYSPDAERIADRGVPRS